MLQLLLSFLEQSSSPALVMSHTWLDRALFFLPHSTSSSPSLLDLPNRTKPCVPPQGPMFGRFAEQSPFTGYEPNAPVEVGGTDVTTVLLPSRKASIGSTCNSGEDMVTTPAVSEVDERSTFGTAGFTTVNTGETCNTIQNLSLSQREFWDTFIARSYQYGKTRGDVLTHEKIKSRSKCLAGVLFRTRKDSFWASKILDFFELRADHAAQGGKAAVSRLSESDIIRDCFLRNKRIMYCLKQLSMNQVYSLTLREWNSTRRIGCLIFQKRKELAMHRNGPKRRSFFKRIVWEINGMKKIVRLTVQIEELQDKFEDIESRILRCLIRRLPLFWTRTSRRKSVWRSERPKWKTDFVVENRLRTWSTNTFG